MANVRECVGKEIEALLKEGLYLMRELKKTDDSKFRAGYQIWYTQALAVVQQLIPERLGEFTSLYGEKVNPYAIGKYLRRIRVGVDERNAAYMRFVQQYRILESTETRLDNILTNIYGLVQAEILDGELDASTELWRTGHIRAAGTLAGVVLERHLAKVCSSRTLTTRKKKPTLSDWNDTLKDANVYDIPTWRGIQLLTDIRNLCAHPGDREPTKEEVDELIRGVERITKTIF